MSRNIKDCFAYPFSASDLCYNLVVIDWLLLGISAFLASTLAAVAGFGGAAVLMPILVIMFGVRDAIPILTVAQLIGNGSRAWFNRRQVELPVVGWFALGGVPAALIGGFLFASAPIGFLIRLLGFFLIFTVVYRHLGKSSALKIPLRGFAVLGAVLSFLSALLGSIGPIMIPFFLAYGLVKGSLIGTEALATVVMHVTKLVAYRRVSILSFDSMVIGLLLGCVMILGSYLGKKILDRLPERVFILLIETTLLVAGIGFLIHG